MLRLTYVIGTYPLLTTTFIDREIQIMRRFGVDIQVVAIRRPDVGTPLSADQRQLQQGVIYLLPAAWLTLLLSQLYFALFRPVRYFGTCAYLVSRPHAGPGARLKTLLHFGEGVLTAYLLRSRQFEELHAHFLDRAATVAQVAGRLLGRPYSLSIHAAGDIFVNPVLLREKLDEARHAVTCTAFNKKHLEALIGSSLDGRVTYVRHGLEPARYQPGAQAAGRPLILAVGQLTERKGFVQLVQACSALRSQGYHFACCIVGRGPQHAELAALIEQLRLADCIELRGALPHEEVVQLFRDASLFALPCIRTRDGDVDGIPNVIAEAMAMEVPVVSTYVSAIPELVQDGVNGLLAPPGDVQVLATCIARLLDDEQLRDELGRNGRRTILATFDVEANVRRFAATLWPAWFGEPGQLDTGDGGIDGTSAKLLAGDRVGAL